MSDIKISTKKLNNWHEIATAIAKQSHDKETQVGAIVINKKTGAIISTGFNGFVRGAQDQTLPSTRPEKYPYMIHAETNAIYNSARHGLSTDESLVYCTLSPCINCSRAMWQAGISEIYFKEMYRDFQNNLNMQDLLITVVNRNDGFYHVKLSPR